jgi:D-inositol-3-phosphate glycosyltransferase
VKIALISGDASPIGHDDGPTGDGRAGYVAHVACELGAAGHHVDVFTRRDDLWSLPVAEIGANTYVMNVPAGPPHFLPRQALLPHMDEFATRFVQVCAAHRGRYDIVHASSFLSGIAAMRLKQRCGVPFVTTFHDLDKVRSRGRACDAFPVERARVEHQLAAAADRLIALHPQERDDLVALYGADPERIDVVPGGVDAAAFGPGSRAARVRFGLRADEFVILQFARFLPGEGVDTAIRAVGQLRRDHGVNARLVISGETDDPGLASVIGRLRVIAAGEHIASQVTYIRTRPHAALRDAYSSADVVVAAPSGDACSVSPLEAMASGVPVIGSDVGTIGQAIQNEVTGYLVPPDDPAALADRLARFHRNPELARAYGRAAIRRVRAGLTWRHAATALARVYAEVLAPYRARLAAAASR